MNEKYPVAKNPLLLRYHRLMDVFTKSDDERDFYLDRIEGFLLYADLDKSSDELEAFEKELSENSHRYCLIPKMTFYEIKKFMEGFVHEKVYDIDTKEKLLDLISAKEARENFLEFIYDHLTELEKWQLYYQERSRIKIIEWLRAHNIQFVFEEDLELGKNIIEKLKRFLFDTKVSKEINQAREILAAKAKTYYSSEALNPRPRRGRPPKQVAKVELEPQKTLDHYSQVPSPCFHFLYIPDIDNVASVTFSSKFETGAQLLSILRGGAQVKFNEKLEALAEKLASLRDLSDRLMSGTKSSGMAEKKGKLFEAPARYTSKEVPVQILQESKAASAAGQVLKKRGRPKRKEEGEDEEDEQATQAPGRGGRVVKKVSQIKRKK